MYKVIDIEHIGGDLYKVNEDTYWNVLWVGREPMIGDKYDRYTDEVDFNTFKELNNG